MAQLAGMGLLMPVLSNKSLSFTIIILPISKARFEGFYPIFKARNINHDRSIHSARKRSN
ncbi:hypothetical protein SAMN05661099_2998 [Daejeonella lutea]|uniref:Uncharacterized protein n=1 Tax=Daejeonella lutea TaxID=572036 RepID=A0A1T5EGD9_9SPHI|nr:hypothetical protein SAMN05661099_2998 [Daejeonella lutea]